MNNPPPMKDPTEELRKRMTAHIGATGMSITMLSTRTGIGVYKLHRWLKGRTAIISYNDALKLERFIGEDAL